MKKIQKFAVFCWTHASLDRDERIQEDWSPERACAASQTIRAQYEGAKARIEQLGGMVVATFFYQEAGHQPTRETAFRMADALRWCLQNSVSPVVNELTEYRSRGFNWYKGFIEIIAPDIREAMFYEASPDESNVRLHGAPVSLEEYFRANRDRERNDRIFRRLRRIKLSRLKGLKRAIRCGARVGFAGNWVGMEEASTKGRRVQRENALKRAEPIIRVVDAIRRSEPSISMSRIVQILNDKASRSSLYKPSRSSRWTEDSLRMLIRRNRERIEK